MIKSIKNLCICAVMSLLLTVNFCLTIANASEWECTSSPAGSSLSEVVGENINLYFQTSNSTGKSNAQKTFDFSENESICISFNMKIEGNSATVTRKLNVQNNAMLSTELLEIKGAHLSVFDEDIQSLEENREYRVEFGIKKDGTATVWLDSEQIYSDPVSNWRNFDYTSMAVLFSSKTTKASTESGWYISDLTVSDSESGFTSTPENEEAQVESTIDSIDVIYNGAKAPAVYQKDNYNLLEDGIAVAFDVERKGNTVKIIPDTGIRKKKEYVLTIYKITDIFGNDEAENETVRFTTAGENYVKATIEISTDEYEIYDNQSTKVNITTQTENVITDSIIYVNGEVYRTFSSEAQSFDFSGESGVYEIYVQSTDEFCGQSFSEKIVIKILHNELPVINVDAVADGMEYDASRLRCITVKASDSDGEVKKIEAYVNDELNTTINGSEGVIDLSLLEYGIYRLKFVAMDNIGATAEMELTITVLKGYNSSKIFSSDFNKYVSDGEVNPGLAFTINGDAQILSRKDYGDEHGTVVLLKTDGQLKEGNSAHGTWGRFPTSGVRDGFKITMDINIVNDKGVFYFMLKHPSQSVLGVDVKIKEGMLTLSDNGAEKIKTELVPGEWYTIDYKVDIKNHKYSFWLNGVLVADDFSMGNKSLEVIDTRFVMDFVNSNEPVACGIAFDNLVIEGISPMPQITSIGYNDTLQCVKISPKANTLKISLNTEIIETTLNSESVLIYCEGEKVNYERIEYDSKTKIVTIILSERLRSNHSYEIIMNNKVTTADGTAISDGMSGEFVTDYNDIDVSVLEMKNDNGEAYAEGVIVNSTGEADEVYVIINVFSGNRLVDVEVKKIQVSKGKQTSFKTDTVVIGQSKTAQVYVWDSIINPSAVLSRTYLFN